MSVTRTIRLGLPVFDVRVGNVSLGSIQVFIGDKDSYVHLFNYLIAQTWVNRGERVAMILEKQSSTYHISVAESFGIDVTGLQDANMWKYEETESSDDTITKAIELVLNYSLLLIDATAWFDPDPSLLYRFITTVASSNSIVVFTGIDERMNKQAQGILEANAEYVLRYETYWAGLRVERIMKLVRSKTPTQPFAVYYTVTKDGINIEELKRL